MLAASGALSERRDPVCRRASRANGLDNELARNANEIEPRPFTRDVTPSALVDLERVAVPVPVAHRDASDRPREPRRFPEFRALGMLEDAAERAHLLDGPEREPSILESR